MLVEQYRRCWVVGMGGRGQDTMESIPDRPSTRPGSSQELSALRSAQLEGGGVPLHSRLHWSLVIHCSICLPSWKEHSSRASPWHRDPSVQNRELCAVEGGLGGLITIELELHLGAAETGSCGKRNSTVFLDLFIYI